MKKFEAVIDEQTCLGCFVADGMTTDKDPKDFVIHDEDSDRKCRCRWVDIPDDNTSE